MSAVVLTLALGACQTAELKQEAGIAILDKFEEVCLAAIKSGRADGMEPLRPRSDVNGWSTLAGPRPHRITSGLVGSVQTFNLKYGAGITYTKGFGGRQACGLATVDKEFTEAVLDRIRNITKGAPESSKHIDAEPEFPEAPYFISISKHRVAPIYFDYPEDGREIYVVWN